VRKLLFFLFLFSSYAAWAQSDTCFDPNYKAYYRCERNVERICKEYLIDDLIELEEKLLTVHPDAYAYCGKEAFDAAYKKAFELMAEKVTKNDGIQPIFFILNLMNDSFPI
jgi:hypothetical protein